MIDFHCLFSDVRLLVSGSVLFPPLTSSTLLVSKAENVLTVEKCKSQLVEVSNHEAGSRSQNQHLSVALVLVL